MCFFSVSRFGEILNLNLSDANIFSAVSLFGNGDGASHLASPVANYADYEARPSTSKSFLPEAAVNSPNGAIKRRFGILENYALPSKNVQQSQVFIFIFLHISKCQSLKAQT